MIQRGTLDISQRRTVCVRDAWAVWTVRKVTASAALQSTCRLSYCAAPWALVWEAVIPTQRAMCPSLWAVLVCHCWKKTVKYRKASQVWGESLPKTQSPAPSGRMNSTDHFNIFFVEYFILKNFPPQFLLSPTERKLQTELGTRD